MSTCPLCISYSTCQLKLINKYQPCLEIKLLVWWFWCHLKHYESILYLTSLLNWSMYIISSNTIIKSPDQYNVLVNCFPIIYFQSQISSKCIYFTLISKPKLIQTDFFSSKNMHTRSIYYHLYTLDCSLFPRTSIFGRLRIGLKCAPIRYDYKFSKK